MAFVEFAQVSEQDKSCSRNPVIPVPLMKGRVVERCDRAGYYPLHISVDYAATGKSGGSAT